MAERESAFQCVTIAHGGMRVCGPAETFQEFPNVTCSSRFVKWLVMQAQKVVGAEGEGGVGPAAVIAEFHLESLGTEDLHNGAHLSADKTSIGQVAHQSNDGKEFEIGHAPSFL